MVEMLWDDDGLMSALRPRPVSWTAPDAKATTHKYVMWSRGMLLCRMSHDWPARVRKQYNQYSCCINPDRRGYESHNSKMHLYS